jgi:cytochrome c-type biogenesis protein CcmF
MFKAWNMSLIVFTYFLIIFGTFITRSGVISSVHAFGKSSLGTFFLVFMIVTLFLALVLMVVKRKLLSGENKLHSLTSRESAFLMGNLVLSAMAFSVFWGTIFPVISELVTSTKITVGVGFYNRVNVPIGLFLMALMGVCPLLAWKRSAGRTVGRDLVLPLVMAAIGTGGALAAGIRNPGTVLVMAFSGLITGSVLTELYRGAAVRKDSYGSSFPVAAARVVWGNRRRYGGYIVHLGMVLIFMGLSGTPLSEEVSGTLKPGESMAVGNYSLKYRKMEWVPSKDRLSVTTRLIAYKDGTAIGQLIPERRFYQNREDQPTSEVSIISNWKEDLYVALTGYNRDGRASFRMLVNPFVPWLWYGGYIVALGTLVAVWPRRRKNVLPERREDSTR